MERADWENSWRLARLPGLGPDNVSFPFKIMHEILQTQEHVPRTKPRANPSCAVVVCTVTKDMPHALILYDAEVCTRYGCRVSPSVGTQC